MCGVRWLLISIHIFKISFAVFSLTNIINKYNCPLTPFLEQNSWQPLARPWNEGAQDGRAQPGEGVWAGLCLFLPFLKILESSPKKTTTNKKKTNNKKKILKSRGEARTLRTWMELGFIWVCPPDTQPSCPAPAFLPLLGAAQKGRRMLGPQTGAATGVLWSQQPSSSVVTCGQGQPSVWAHTGQRPWFWLAAFPRPGGEVVYRHDENVLGNGGSHPSSLHELAELRVGCELGKQIWRGDKQTAQVSGPCLVTGLQ